jgi:monoamine oxidase
VAHSRILNKALRILRSQAPSDQRALLSRRDVLRIGAGAALGLGLSRPVLARASSEAPQIAIVGAGISGLTAALTLQDSGVPCRVFEAGQRIGGRMHSNDGFWAQGQTSEWCGEFVDTGHTYIRRLARRFGLTLDDVNAAQPPGSVDTLYVLGTYYTDAELASDLAKLAPIIGEQLRRVGPVVRYNHYTPAAYRFDHTSAYEWIETYVPGGHSSRLGRYLDVGLTAENGIDTKRQSSLNIILAQPSDMRFHIRGGNQQLPLAILRSLPRETVSRGWRLTKIATNDERGPSLTFATDTETRELDVDYAILALPFSVLRRLDFAEAGFDRRKQIAIRELGYGTNSKLSLQFDKRYWNGRGAWPGVSNGFIITDLPFMVTWDSSRAEPGVDGLLTNFTGGARGASFEPDGPYTTSKSSAMTAAYARSFVAELERVWPGVSSHYTGLATLSHPQVDPKLLGSYSANEIGQYTAFSGYERVPQGRISFAGEHTSLTFQGFMEGGAEAGTRAARELLATIRGAWRRAG